MNLDQLTQEELNALIFIALADVAEKHIAPIFKPEAKITIIVRIPGNNDADAFLTSDEIDEIAAAVERSRTRDDITLDTLIQ